MIHNHKLLNIILPTVIIGSYFSYNRNNKNRFQNNLENKIHGEIASIIDKSCNSNSYNKYHLIESYITNQSSLPNGWIFNETHPEIIKLRDQFKKTNKSITFDNIDTYAYNKYVIVKSDDAKHSVLVKLTD